MLKYAFYAKILLTYTKKTYLRGRSSKMTAEAINNSSKEKTLNLFHLSWPIFLEMFLFMIMGTIDTMMLSDISDNAVSGVGAANQFMHIAILVLEVIGNGAAIVVAQYLGSKLFYEASRITALAVTMNTIIGIIISIGFIFFGEHLLVLLNLSGEVLVYAKKYLVIVGGTIFLQAIINSLSAIIRVHGFTKQAMYVALGMNIVHIIANYALIYGNWGMPKLGVEGAAISTVGSRVLALLVFFWILYRVIHHKIKWKYYLSISKDYIFKILKIGLPSALEQVMYQGCQIVFLFYVTFLGEHALAARQYASNISMFIYLFALAVGMGTSIMVGRYIGAKKSNLAYTQVFKSTGYAFIGTGIMLAFIVIFRENLVSIFTDNPDVIKLGADVLLYGIILETGRSINIVCVNSLRASGNASFPLYVGFFTMVLMSLPLGYLFVFHLDMGLIGVWLAIAADEWARAFIMLLRWKSKKWEKYALVKDKSTSTVSH